jgi:hypothetical protein
MPADKEPLVPLDEIARLLESHEGPPDPRRKPASGSRSGLRAVGVVGAGALVAGSALGFGVGSAFTSSETAQAAAVGTGFLPARGWTVVQSGTTTATGTARAIAANVPLDARDDVDGLPVRTLESLPARGVVIVATFTTRGDAGVDAAFPGRSLPLQVQAAEQHGAEHRLRAGVKGTNVDARIFFGRSRPTAAMLAAAQRQLQRLAVASDQVTIFARPTIIPARDPWTTIYGSVASTRAGEPITIQAKDCGSDFFRVVDDAATSEGGGWSTRYSPGISTTLRAVWNGRASNQVSVRQRPWVSLLRLSRGPWHVSVGSTPRGGMPGGIQSSFWGRRVTLQRFNQRSGWRPIKRVVLRSDGAEFALSLPKGTLIRAVLPLSEARPCYLEGVSFTVRT